MTLILWLVTVYAAICGAAFFGNRLLMYFPDPTRVAPVAAGLSGVKEIEIAVADGITLIAWHAPAKEDKPTILYFHGNAANAANRAPKIEKIRERGFGVFYLNNRGYGGSGGRPTEKDNVADAIAAYDHLIGFGVAGGQDRGLRRVARLWPGGAAGAARPVAAVVLEAPLTSTIDVAWSTYFWLPLGLLITDKYNNERNIRFVTGAGSRPAWRAGCGDPGGNGLAGLPRSQRAKAD